MQIALVALFLLSTPHFLSLNTKSQNEAPPQYVQDYNAGVEAQKNKDYPKAIEHYQSALNKKSDYAEAWNNLGFCNRMIAKTYLKKAGDAYTKAVNYNPSLPEAIEYQGEYFIMVGKFNSAFQNYQKLKQMNSPESGELKASLDSTLNEAKSVLKVYSP
jgi:tetratricopeptide (TPR) repeat protein